MTNSKKVLVAGGAGYIGGHVAEELHQRGFQVTVYDLQKPEWLPDSIEFIQGDLSNYEGLRRAVQGKNYVYNFASIADIGEATKDRIKTIEVNVLGGAKLLEACVQEKIEKFILASTIYVYSTKGSFYRISKQASEALVEEYCKKFPMDYSIIRYGSLYGGRTQEWNGLRKYIESIIQNQSVTLKSQGKAKRDYIHILDATKMSVDILDEKYNGESVTLTGTQSIAAEELIHMIGEILELKIQINYSDANNNDHYELTPYRYQPKLGVKLVRNEFIDFGQGLLEMIHDIKSKKHG